MRPLFIIGNKRSGTSQLVRVLNLQPHVFVSHESDIVWILHQFHRDQKFQAHPWDSDRGMRVTLETAGGLLRREASPWENFVAVQMSLMEKGTPWLTPQKKTELRWIGDKKPMQHTDPELLKFILTHFSEARFLHIVRHPFEVIASSNRFNETADGDFWLGLSSEEKMERWAFHEQQVLQLREALPKKIHSLRYEDFCHDTKLELSKVLEFLGLELNAQALHEAAQQTLQKNHAVPAVRYSAETARIAAIYGYDLQRGTGKLQTLAQRIFRPAIKS